MLAQQGYCRIVSRVGWSPAQAMTTSSLRPGRCRPQSQMQASCAVRDGLVHGQVIQRGCLPATITLTYPRLRRQWSATDSRQLASGGR